MKKKFLLITLASIFSLSIVLCGCGNDDKSTAQLNEKEETKETGVIGDYAATLEVVDDFNTKCFSTSSFMTTSLDEDGLPISAFYENQLMIENKDDLDNFIKEIKNVAYSPKTIETIESEFAQYDQTYFENKNIYVFCISTSCPSYELVRTTKLSTSEVGKYDYVLEYKQDVHMSINGFVNYFFVIEMDKTICDEMKNISIQIVD